MPHAADPIVELEAALAEMTDIVKSSLKLKLPCVWGIDANAVLGNQVDSDNPAIIGRYGLGARNSRGGALAAWMHQANLVVANTRFCKTLGRLWTHKHWATGNLSQIDFVLASRSIAGSLKNCDTLDDLISPSDHRPLLVTFQDFCRTSKRWRAPRKPVGWKPTLDSEGARLTYHNLLDNLLAKEDVLDLSKLNSLIVVAAEAGAHLQGGHEGNTAKN